MMLEIRLNVISGFSWNVVKRNVSTKAKTFGMNKQKSLKLSTGERTELKAFRDENIQDFTL